MVTEFYLQCDERKLCPCFDVTISSDLKLQVLVENDVDCDPDAKHVRDNRVCSAPANARHHPDQSPNVKTTKEVKGATFYDKARVIRAFQCQFHKPQSLVAGGETNYDGSRATIIPCCKNGTKETNRQATDFRQNFTI